MKRTHFQVANDGFCGVYWEGVERTNAAIILMLGNDSESYMIKTGVK